MGAPEIILEYLWFKDGHGIQDNERYMHDDDRGTLEIMVRGWFNDMNTIACFCGRLCVMNGQQINEDRIKG